MTQHTQPVGAAQHQQHQQQQQQQTSTPQQQQPTTTNTCSNNNNNTTPTTSNPTTNNNQTQTVAVQQQQQSHSNNNNNNANNNNSYQSQQQNAAVGQVFNPQLQPANVYVPTHGMPAHHHPHHQHQPGAMYQTMIPAAIPSNVYVNNVTANVNLHGWTHTVPHSAWVHPSGTPHYIHGDLPPEQGASVIQPMGAIPVALSTPNALTGSVMNPNTGAISGGTRGTRRGRGRGGASGSRRSDYNIQRHPQPEGSPAPQQSGQTNQQEMQQQQPGQQQTDAQQMMTTLPPSYVPHPQYAAHTPQYPYAYPTFFAPQQHMIHPGQSTAAQQATGTPLYFSAMPVYNGAHMYNYGYYLPPVMNPSEYQYGEEVGVDDERQTAGEGGAMMWHPQPIYSDEYGMNPADMQIVASDDMNHNASSMGSTNETPSMLSPNYAPMYEQMTQQMGVMQIYEDPQMAQMQVIHSQTGMPQMEEEISECGSQTSASLQMVPPIQMVPAAAPPSMALPVANPEQILHQPTPHLIAVTGGAMMSIDGSLPINATPRHHIQQHGDNTTDASLQTYENVSNIPAESYASLNEEIVQQPAENIETEYQRHNQQQQQQQQTQPQVMQTRNFQQEEIKSDNFKSSKIVTSDVQEHQESSSIKTSKVTIDAETTCTDVAIETTTTIVSSNNQQQTVYQQQSQEKHKQQQYVNKQNISQQQQQYQQQKPQAQQVSQQQQHQQQAAKTAQQQQQQQQHQQQQTHYQTSSQHQHPHTHHQHQQQQHAYENRKSSQTYNQQHQSRSRKYEYHHSHASSSSNNDNSSHQQHHHHQQHQQQPQQTTKTMSWTNSAQHKKSTNTVAVTATPTTSHTSGGYNKQSNTPNSSNSNAHGSRTYTNQHNYHQNYHYQQQQHQHQPQTRNYGAMKMPSSPISSAPNTMERKTSQSSDKSQTQQQQSSQTQSTSTASTTAVPHQFQKQQSQQTSTTNDNIHTQPSSTGTHTSTTTASTATTVPFKPQSQSHYATGFVNKKYSFSNQGNSGTSTISTTAATTSSVSTTVDTSTAPAINLAPPVTNTTPAVSSTPSWASLFASNSNTGGNTAFPVTTTAAASNLSASPSASSTTTAYSKKPVAKVAPYEGLTPVSPPLPIVTPGTLSYSAASAQNLPPTPASTSSTSLSTKKASPNEQQAQRNSLANLDEYSLKFADFLTKYKSDWTNVSLRPRGLTNRSNYCYINSILQALLGCSPLYNLIRSIPKQAANLCEVKTPTINAMITFMSNFSNLPGGLRLRNAKGGKGNKDDLGGDLQCDSAFEPTEIYKLWNDSREEHVEGRQEDAEEFLSYILNKLNDEMLEVIKLIARPNTEQNGPNEPLEEDGDVWQMICNNRNKGSVTRQTDFGCTPLSDIFRGELRSRLQREGEHSTDVIQPFFTLQLNIEKAASVKEALEILVGRDQLEGVTGSKSKQEVVAWQQMNLEKLPPILILHLKWFDYRSDGCTKILKKVEFPVELKIDTKILASKKYSQKQRAYRLFAVVYHDGKEATKGHYITDVYHTGYGSWLRYDDSSVKPVNENHVLLPRTPRVPYLLCYRRCDTIQQQSNNNQQNSSTGNNNNSSGNTTQSSALAK